MVRDLARGAEGNLARTMTENLRAERIDAATELLARLRQYRDTIHQHDEGPCAIAALIAELEQIAAAE